MRIASILTAASLASTLLAQTPERGVFLQDLDRSANACDNFFDYANGAWRKANPIPPSMQRWSRRWAAGERNKEELFALVEELSANRDWPKGSVEQQIRDFFSSCMNESRINALGIKPLKPLLDAIDAIDSPAALQKTLVLLHDLQITAPFGVRAMSDNRDPSDVIASVYASGIALPDRDYYLSQDKRFVDTREKYLGHIARMFELAGASKSAAKEASGIVMGMETRLAEAHLDNVSLRDPQATDHKMSVAALQEMTPHFNWARYLDRIGVPPADLNVAQPKFMAAVDHELASTSLSHWKTYLKWHLLNASATQLSRELVEQDFAFYGQHLRGAKEIRPRWKRCIDVEDSLLGDALGKKYVERHFPPVAKARMQEMVKNILLAMGDTIRTLEWMGPETKTKALEKLSTFKPKVGYPDKWKDYSSITISPGSHLSNVMAGLHFVMKDNRSQIGKPLDRSRWAMTPPTSNAYYSRSLNEIVFPAGILRPPAFDVNAADAVNYGAIGVVIGHEISHGFDDQGAKFDAQGRLSNWWTDDDLKRFQERGQCVSEQYEGYFIEPGLHHKGGLVLGESIGDLAGAKIAWLAFQKAQKTKPAPTIDGLTPAQQFFIAWGQFRGDEIRPESQRLMIQGDPHPVSKYRVIGPLANMPEFAETFGCKANDPMVRPPEKRCEVW